MGIYKLRTEFATHLRVILWAILIIFVIGAIWMFNPSSGEKTAKESKQVIINVENTEIKRHIFDIEWDNVYNMLSGRNARSPFQFANVKGMIVSNIIDSQKIIIIAEKQGIKISKKDIKNAIDERVIENLKANRAIVLGDISEEQEKIDPRKDKKYLSALSANGLNVDSIASNAKASVSEFSIKAELARTALLKQSDGNLTSITDAEVNKSFDNYSVDMIIIDPTKSTETKAKEVADKVLKDIKAGADFAKLRTQHSAVDMPTMDYNFVDMPWLLPPDVADKVIKLSAGQITEAIKTDNGIYIVKVAKITNKKPEKFDNKSKEERKKLIQTALEQKAERALMDEMKKITDVSVIDPELAGYYYSSLAESERDPIKAKAHYTKAKEELGKALNKKEVTAGDDIMMAQQAYINYCLEDYKTASELLYKMLDDPNSQVSESFDLRMLFGECYMKLKQNDKAIAQFESASELNRSNSGVHEALAEKFKELGRADLAAREMKTAAEIKEFEEKQADSMNMPEVPVPTN